MITFEWLGQIIRIKDFSFSRDGKFNKITKELIIANKNIGREYSEKLKTGNIDLSFDDKEYNKQLAFYKERLSKKQSMTNVEKFLNMKVEFTTVPIKKSKVEILKY
jgi:hypothetical protein